jgi:hypothetical protein
LIGFAQRAEPRQRPEHGLAQCRGIGI